MARQFPQWKYLQNKNPYCLEIHDLDNEQNGCKISSIKLEHIDFLKATGVLGLADWLRKNPGYDGCNVCLPEFHRK